MHEEPGEENKRRGSSSLRSPCRAASALPPPQQGWWRGGCISGSHCPGEVTRIWALTENATSPAGTRTMVRNRVKRKSPNPVQYANDCIQLYENNCPGTAPNPHSVGQHADKPQSLGGLVSDGPLQGLWISAPACQWDQQAHKVIRISSFLHAHSSTVFSFWVTTPLSCFLKLTDVLQESVGRRIHWSCTSYVISRSPVQKRARICHLHPGGFPPQNKSSEYIHQLLLTSSSLFLRKR